MEHRFSIRVAGVVLSILVLGLVSCGGEPGRLTGTVTGAEDGQPVAGAEILAFALEKVKGVTSVDVYQKTNTVHREVTDAQGTFSVALPPARYVVEVRIQGVRVTSRLVEVQAGRTLTADFQIVPPSP